MSIFRLVAPYEPCGDQPQAIEKLANGIRSGNNRQVLVGVTGSGKTFTMANIIAQFDMPVLVISHNKTLAAQLYSEFKEFFPDNAVEYFVSYYDYYQPEAYIPHTQTYIAKDASINENLDKLRLAATGSLLSRKDTIVVASVSCIYGLGSPEEWSELLIRLSKDEHVERDTIIERFVEIQYERTDDILARGMFRVRGETIEILPPYGDHVVRINFCDDEIEGIEVLDPGSYDIIKELDAIAIYPAKHFVTTGPRVEEAIRLIEEEVKEHVEVLKELGNNIEAERILSRTRYDIEILREVGYCSGIENYSRHLSAREPGSPPYSLIDYFAKDFLVIVDESHVSIPQIRGMFNGDRCRKETLVKHGFRLPSALDNRPLNFREFEERTPRTMYVSATPGPYERQHADQVVEQVIRPTGLLDPPIEVRPTENHIDDVIAEVRARLKQDEKTLITTLTKRMSEELSRYLHEAGLPVTYLHSELDAIERVEVLRGLREGKYGVVVGVNLLREGLDLPEVSLVIILDADKEGFLRDAVSLTQTAGRAARNINGKVIMYADKMTKSMKATIDETARRRAIQEAYNTKHGITPRSIKKAIVNGIERLRAAKKIVADIAGTTNDEEETHSYLLTLEARMEEAAARLDFTLASRLRDELLVAQEKVGLSIISYEK